MLDFSKYREHLAIFRTTTEGTLWRTFDIPATDIPALFAVFRNGTTERINFEKSKR